VRKARVARIKRFLLLGHEERFSFRMQRDGAERIALDGGAVKDQNDPLGYCVKEETSKEGIGVSLFDSGAEPT
jgi:hypothetical protein